jgi:glycosyltransferase involved in cell wall biosynthesis
MSAVPNVSVVISTHNRSASLLATLRSLRRQRVPPDLTFEAIVVDNNSSDDTAAVVHRFVRDQRQQYRYLFEARPGVSYGRNAGIQAARAPIIAFTDDDNLADERWIATIDDVLRRYPDVAAVGGRIVPEWPAAVPRWLDHRHWSPLAILDYGDNVFHTSADNPRCVLTANLAIRRNVFSQIGQFSTDFYRCQDHEFLIRLWRAGGRVLYVPHLVVRAPIEPVRLTPRYHRAWHSRHGRFTAGMRLQEIIDRNGRLLAEPPDVPRLHGTPGHVYRALASHIWRWTVAVLRLDRADAAAHEHRVRYFVAYIRETARAHAEDGRTGNTLAFAWAHLARCVAIPTMRPGRIVLVQLLIAVLVGGSAYDIITGREHWPFSPYPMFSTVERAPTLDVLRLFGVSDEPSPREIPLLDQDAIAPFDQARLATALARTVSDPANAASPDRKQLIAEVDREGPAAGF